MIDRFEVSYEVQGKKYTDECPTLYKAALKAKELLNEPYLNYRRFGGEGLTITHNQYASEEQQRQHFTFNRNANWTEYMNDEQRLDEMIERNKPVPKIGDLFCVQGASGYSFAEVIASENDTTMFMLSRGEKSGIRIEPTEEFIRSYVPADEPALQNYPDAMQKVFTDTPVLSPETAEENTTYIVENANHAVAVLSLLKENQIDMQTANDVLNGRIVPEYYVSLENGYPQVMVSLETPSETVMQDISGTLTIDEQETLYSALVEIQKETELTKSGIEL